LVQVPAVWLVAALAVLGLALGSRWATAGWVVLVAFFLVGPLAELLQLPAWVADLSPYSQVPKVPAEPFTIGPELALTGVAAAVLATAWGRYRTRDVG
jgi:ABC-2 type transport system permease protein